MFVCGSKEARKLQTTFLLCFEISEDKSMQEPFEGLNLVLEQFSKNEGCQGKS